MKRLFFSVLLSCSVILVLAQKKLIDIHAPETWPIMSVRQISADGKFITYSISTPKNGNNLYVQSTDGSVKFNFPNVSASTFTLNSSRLIFSKKDTIGIFNLVKNNLTYIKSVDHYLIPTERTNRWLAYKLKQPENELVLLDLFSAKEQHFSNVTDFKFSQNGKVLLIEREDLYKNIHQEILCWNNLEDGEIRIVDHGFQAKNFVFDKKGNQLVYTVNMSLNNQEAQIRYFKVGMSISRTIVNRLSAGMEAKQINAEMPIYFSNNGNRIFFYLQERIKNPIISKPNTVKVSIRDYKDHESPDILKAGSSFIATTGFETDNHIIQLQQISDNPYLFGTNLPDNYFLIAKPIRDTCNFYNNRIAESSYDVFVASTKNGARMAVRQKLVTRNIQFSPGLKYLFWYDGNSNNWFTFNLKTGITKNVSINVKDRLYFDHGENHNAKSTVSYPFIGWFEGDKYLLIQSQNDTWKVDAEGIKTPTNLTKQYAQLKQVELNYLSFNNEEYGVFKTGDTLLYSCFDELSKQSGFYRLTLGKTGNTERLLMEPKMYFHIFSDVGAPGMFYPFRPLKAANANVFAVVRMSETEYPNLYITRDFKTFKQLTNLEPQKDFNWFTVDLCHWTLPNGHETSGILYKPENFDPSKKYPVVLYYYEQNSDALHYYIHPALSNGAINIPMLVSNGFIVFIPDISYEKGYPGQSALNSVVSAAQYLSAQPYIDSKHIGLQGHSFGGFETNYIIANSHLFAAAATAAGASDLVSEYVTDRDMVFYEKGQGRIGASLWQRPDLYIKNSPIFNADQVTTPLLILHGKNDPLVYYSQAEQWFNGLARSGKKVWMLNYENEGHTLKNNANQTDYTIRLWQFFDYYLKALPPPKWMTSANLDTDNSIGYELDNREKEP